MKDKPMVRVRNIGAEVISKVPVNLRKQLDLRQTADSFYREVLDLVETTDCPVSVDEALVAWYELTGQVLIRADMKRALDWLAARSWGVQRVGIAHYVANLYAMASHHR